MTEPASIFQCEKCQRYCAGDEVFRFLAPSSAEFEAFKSAEYPQGDCGRSDCASVVAEKKQAEQEKTQRRIDRRKQLCATQARRRVGFTKPAASLGQSESRSPYKDDGERFEGATGPDLSHRDEQRRFAAAGDGDNDCEKMIEILFEAVNKAGQKFDPLDTTRQSAGGWVFRHDLVHKHGIATPNSRASQLRGCKSYDPHPLVKRYRLDIDSRPAAGGWEYRICFIENSERLKREQDKDDGQEKFA